MTLHNFRTQGAFLISAVRKAGATRFIRIRSLAGEPLKLRHGLTGSLTVLLDDGTPARTRDLGDGTLAIDLPENREVLVHCGARPDLVIPPVTVSEPGRARRGACRSDRTTPPGTGEPPCGDRAVQSIEGTLPERCRRIRAASAARVLRARGDGLEFGQ
ncbi:hypothetical protein GCM10010339_56200 [Streptomyces alanosinicus]|uniref:Uncharacterized protein n=1 Tax=Streptomyces alanosinicus TaxID=68171 RepID=A0A918YNZ3_9ACTN|nr:hypothetical protein GCM10010339_56200 [Streptomyces alanosinicus]